MSDDASDTPPLEPATVDSDDSAVPVPAESSMGLEEGAASIDETNAGPDEVAHAVEAVRGAFGKIARLETALDVSSTGEWLALKRTIDKLPRRVDITTVGGKSRPQNRPLRDIGPFSESDGDNSDEGRVSHRIHIRGPPPAAGFTEDPMPPAPPAGLRRNFPPPLSRGASTGFRPGHVPTRPTRRLVVRSPDNSYDSYGSDYRSDHARKSKDRWLNGVLRLAMDEWRQLCKRRSSQTWAAQSRFRPVSFEARILVAFYNKVPMPPGGSQPYNQAPPVYHHQRSGTIATGDHIPRRLLICSDVLLADLEQVSGHHLQDQKLILIPPYKLLLHNWARIGGHLSRLKSQLKELESKQHNRVTEPAYQSTNEESVSVDGSNLKENTRQPSDLADLQERVTHLQCLVDFVNSELAHLVTFRQQVLEGNLDKVTYQDIYYLFRVGDVVISRHKGEHQLYQIFAVTGGRQCLSRAKHTPYDSDLDSDEKNSALGIGVWTTLKVDAYILGSDDGKRIFPIPIRLRVQPFTGERKITDLPVFPVRFHKSGQDIRKRLQNRGRKFLVCAGHKRYRGATVKSPLEDIGRAISAAGRGGRRSPDVKLEKLENEMQNDQIREVRSDVYIDLDTYYHHQAGVDLSKATIRRSRMTPREVVEQFSTSIRVVENNYSSGDVEVDETLTDEFLMSHRDRLYPEKVENLVQDPEALELLPHQVPAYDFRSRQWVWLDVDKVEEIEKGEEARQSGWQDLVIPESYKSLLVSLVDSHESNPDEAPSDTTAASRPRGQIDLVRGKGRGLIILLHGPPGSGKTSTAETIAAYTGRPLYAITCGDIGETASEVEKNLQHHTQLAAAWGCVLLLDEADVFLMRRSWNTVSRNAIVSVFLRHLEYYTGILFLTTNIVGVIDEAFKSRIHIALQYPGVDLHSTEKIWNNLLDRIQRDNDGAAIKIEFSRELLLEFARDHFNAHKDSQTTWNGRQVRNAFQTAIAMGQYERLGRAKDEGLTPAEAERSGDKKLRTARLTRRNFEKIAKTARDFEDYITSTRGVDSQVAQASQLRDDDFGRKMARAKKSYPSRGHAKGLNLFTTSPAGKGGKGKGGGRRSVQDDDEEESLDDEEVGAPELSNSEEDDER